LDLQELKTLAGITNTFTGLKPIEPVKNISYTGTEKAELQRKHNIEPGTDAWFRLWFSLPKLTGEKPI
jgi:hypothetical protein